MRRRSLNPLHGTSRWLQAALDTLNPTHPHSRQHRIAIGLFIDGRLTISLPLRPSLDPDQPYRFWFGGRSVRTDVLLDNLRLWRGLRWVVGSDGEAILGS